MNKTFDSFTIFLFYLISGAEHADDPLAESFTLGAEEGNEEMETAEGQNGDHEPEGEEAAEEVRIFFSVDLADLEIRNGSHLAVKPRMRFHDAEYID